MRETYLVSKAPFGGLTMIKRLLAVLLVLAFAGLGHAQTAPPSAWNGSGVVAPIPDDIPGNLARLRQWESRRAHNVAQYRELLQLRPQIVASLQQAEAWGDWVAARGFAGDLGRCDGLLTVIGADMVLCEDVLLRTRSRLTQLGWVPVTYRLVPPGVAK
jgi:hypothetical protein